MTPSFSSVTEAPLAWRPGHLEQSAVRFTLSAEAAATFADAASLPPELRAPLPAGTTISGSLGTSLSEDAIHHRLHFSGQDTASLLAWGTSVAHAAVGEDRPALCGATDAFCVGDRHTVVVGRLHTSGVTVDVVIASPVTARLLQASRDEPLPALEAPPAAVGQFGVDIDNKMLQAVLSNPAQDTPSVAPALQSLQVRGRVESRRIRARFRWSTLPGNTAPWRSRNAQMSAPSLESWCGDVPCVVVSTVPSPADLRTAFPPRAQPQAGDSVRRLMLLEQVAFAWPHTLAARTKNPLDPLQSPAGGFAAAAIEAVGTIEAAGVRWTHASPEAFVRGPKATVDLAAGLLAYVGNVETVDAGDDRVSRATSPALPSPVFLALDDDTAQSDGWIALVPDVAAFARLRKQPAVHYGPPWLYANVPELSRVAPGLRSGIGSIRALGTVENDAFVLDIEAHLAAP